uniref:F-box domain-containing protein n=1 Tax=Mycena chlorophos TaxID=658473 RepID=A0ABQ0LY53_MYCCL|nr:predicted protein [Mycena chlorophos]
MDPILDPGQTSLIRAATRSEVTELNAELQSTLLLIETKLLALDEGDKEARNALISLRDECLALLAPVRRLPVELLVKIFHLLAVVNVDNNGMKAYFWGKVLRQTTIMGNVCSRWFRIVQGTPSLWSTVAIDLALWVDPTWSLESFLDQFNSLSRLHADRGEHSDLEATSSMPPHNTRKREEAMDRATAVLKTVLASSAEIPLDVYIDFEGDSTAFEEAEATTKVPLLLILQHSARLRTLAGIVPHAYLGFLQESGMRFPMLDGLFVAQRGGDSDVTQETSSGIQFVIDASQLKSLVVSAKAANALLGQGTSLPVPLRSLGLVCMTLEDLHAVLPHLQGFDGADCRIHIKIVDSAWATAAHTSVHVDILVNELRIHSDMFGDGLLDAIFTRLTLPTLTTLALSCAANSPLAWAQESFRSLGQRSGFASNLKHLSLEGIFLSSREWEACLADIPLLTKLSMSDFPREFTELRGLSFEEFEHWEPLAEVDSESDPSVDSGTLPTRMVTREVLLLLTLSGKDTVALVPMLEHITLRIVGADLFDTGALVRMAISRAGTAEAEGRRRKLLVTMRNLGGSTELRMHEADLLQLGRMWDQGDVGLKLEGLHLVLVADT